MKHWIQSLWLRLSGKKPDRRFFKPPVVPSAFDDPKTAIAFADGEFCVAVLKEVQASNDPGYKADITVSFSLRKPMPQGKWVGFLEVPRSGLEALRSLMDQANDYLRELDDRDEDDRLRRGYEAAMRKGN